MNRTQAIEAAAELKGLMPMLTDEQARIVVDEVTRRDDPTGVKRAIREYVTDHEQFTVASFCASLPPRAGESSADAATMTREQQAERRAQGRALEAQHKADNDLCERLDDATFERCAHAVLREAFEPEIAALYSRRPLRSWQSIRCHVAAYCRANGVVSSDVMKVA